MYASFNNILYSAVHIGCEVKFLVRGAQVSGRYDILLWLGGTIFSFVPFSWGGGGSKGCVGNSINSVVVFYVERLSSSQKFKIIC